MLLQIATAVSHEDLEAIQRLLLEYWELLALPPTFQGFATEVKALPGKYAQPSGRLALARIDGEPAGCIALRPIDSQRCEAKRLFVRPSFRGQGIGRELLHWIIAEARNAGYAELMGDTLPSMSEALAMYQRLGFREVGPYSAEATPGAIYLSLRLQDALPKVVDA